MPPKRKVSKRKTSGKVKKGNVKASATMFQRSSAPVTSSLSSHVGAMPARMGVAPATRMFPEGGVSISFCMRSQQALFFGGSTWPQERGIIARTLSEFTSYGGACFAPVHLGYSSVLSGNNTYSYGLAGSSAPRNSLFPLGLLNMAYQFSHGRVRKLRFHFIPQLPTSFVGSVAVGFVRDAESAVANTSGNAGVSWNATYYVQDLAGASEFPLWEHGSILAIDEKVGRAEEPLPLGGGYSVDISLAGNANFGVPPAQFALREMTQGALCAITTGTNGTSGATQTHTIWVEAIVDLYGPILGIVSQPAPTVDPTLVELRKLQEQLQSTGAIDAPTSSSTESKGEWKVVKEEDFATPHPTPRQQAVHPAVLRTREMSVSTDPDVPVAAKTAAAAGASRPVPSSKDETRTVDASRSWFGKS